MGHEAVDFVTERVSTPVLILGEDIIACIGITATTVPASLATTGVFRTLLVLPILLFLPGYAVISALYPESPDSTANFSPDDASRAALSLGISFTLLPLLGFLLSITRIGFTSSIVIGSLGLITVVGILIAGRRRAQIQTGNQYQISLNQIFKEIYHWFLPKSEGRKSPSNAVLFMVAIVAVSTLTYGIIVPLQTESYSSFSVLTQQPSGDLVASGYPTSITQAGSEELVLAVENNERQGQRYTVVTELQRIDSDSGTVTERVELDRVSEEVAVGATWQSRVTLEPRLAGENLRAAFYLYTGSIPQEPSTASSDEHLFLWGKPPRSILFIYRKHSPRTQYSVL